MDAILIFLASVLNVSLCAVTMDSLSATFSSTFSIHSGLGFRETDPRLNFEIGKLFQNFQRISPLEHF